jgi:hypothetical protein
MNEPIDNKKSLSLLGEAIGKFMNGEIGIKQLNEASSKSGRDIAILRKELRRVKKERMDLEKTIKDEQSAS